MEAKHWLWSWQIWIKPTASAMDSLPNSAQKPVLCLVAQSYLTLCDLVDCSPPGSSVHGDSPGKNTGVGSHAFLQGIFPTQGSNPGLLHCRWIRYCLSHQGSPWALGTPINYKNSYLYITWPSRSHKLLGVPHPPGCTSSLRKAWKELTGGWKCREMHTAGAGSELSLGIPAKGKRMPGAW